MHIPTDEQVVRQGQVAEAILLDDGFNELFNDITQELSFLILASPLHDKETREEAYLTYHGMRHFINKLKAFRSAKDETIGRNDYNNQLQEDN